jgi:5-methylcytosine-specific restriction endonuclease McrA
MAADAWPGAQLKIFFHFLSKLKGLISTYYLVFSCFFRYIVGKGDRKREEPTMTRFQPGKSPAAAHHALASTIATMHRAHGQAVLWFADIQRRRLYRELGFSSMNMYAKEKLGFSERRASDFSRLAGLMDDRTLIRRALAADEIGWTKALDIARISDAGSEGKWLEVARSCSRRDLATKIRRAKDKAVAQQSRQPRLPVVDRSGKTAKPATPAPRPEPSLPPAARTVKVTLEFTPEQFAMYEALWTRLAKASRQSGVAVAARPQAVLEMMAHFLEESGQNKSGDSAREESHEQESHEQKSPAQKAAPSPTTPRVHLHLHHCPECEKTVVPTSRGELPVSAATLERSRCDVVLVQPGKRNRTTIPPKTRREVLARDRHRCTRPGCRHHSYLEVHHIIPREKGGTNEAANLITLCWACHQLVHEKKWNLVREREPSYGQEAGGSPSPRIFSGLPGPPGVS